MPRTRGQALVEFALLLPILALLMVLAVDFGRVFFGWVGLQNAARIAANEAAFNPDAWTGSGDPDEQARYRQTVMNDMTAINCTPPGGTSWSTTDIPDPTWKNVGGTTSPTELGDYAVIDLQCRFTFITPLVATIIGGAGLTIGAHAEYPIRGGLLEDLPVATVAPTPTPAPTATPAPSPTPDPSLNCVTPELIGKTVTTGQVLWIVAGFTGSYDVVRPPNNNYTIGAQSLVGGQSYPCTTPVSVSKT